MFVKSWSYVDKSGRTYKIVDRTVGLPRIKDEIRLFFRKMVLRVQSVVKIFLPCQSVNGRYAVRNGKLTLLARKVGVFDVWFHKNKVYSDQGDREKHNFYVGQEEKGLLNAVDDKSVWKESLGKYGRGRVDTGYDSRVSRDRRR